MKAQLENLRTKYTGSDLRREVTALIWKLSGPDHRFTRQSLYRELTGQNILVAQAGVNRLVEAAMKYLASDEQPTEEETGTVVFMDNSDVEEQTQQITVSIESGLVVIRKACKRAGVVQSVENDKVTVLLADGSVRKPNRERFMKLYQFQ